MKTGCCQPEAMSDLCLCSKILFWGILATINFITAYCLVISVIVYFLFNGNPQFASTIGYFLLSNAITILVRLITNKGIKNFFQPNYSENIGEIMAYLTSAPFMIFYLYKIIRR